MNLNIYLPRFVIGFPHVPKPTVGIWLQLAKFLAAHNALPKTVELSQMAGAGDPEKFSSNLTIKLPVEDVEKVILERHLTAFLCYAGAGSKEVKYHLTDHRGSPPGSILYCHFEKSAKIPSCWTALIESIMSEHQSVGAWQFITLYHSWQSGDTVDRFYEMRWGKLPPGYRTWNEPFPGPVEQPDILHVDVSLNPGRTKNLLQMVNFYPTAEMWLGPHFWPYAKCTKEEALAADFWLEKRDTPHYTYFKCWPTPFTRPDGEQGRMQQRLWKLFFHEDCEWPPGSGIICDEPLYGPPELMPVA